MTGLRFELGNEILRITFLKPATGNSFSVEDALALTKAIQDYRTKIRGLLWTSGPGRIFSGGGDLKKHVQLKNKKQGIMEARKIASAFEHLAALPLPKAVVIEGDCFGGGLELISCFDYLVASPHVLFGFWQRRIGLSFGWGGFRRWMDRVEEGAIKNLAFSARVFGAREALRVGIIDAIGSRDIAEAWLRQSLQWSDPSGQSLSRLAVASERRLFEGLWWSREHLAAIKKFVGHS